LYFNKLKYLSKTGHVSKNNAPFLQSKHSAFLVCIRHPKVRTSAMLNILTDGMNHCFYKHN